MNYENKLKEIREEHNLSQEEVATILNIKRSTYGHYETEYQTIPINHLINFCEHFNISIDYIFNFSKNKTIQYNKYADFLNSTNKQYTDIFYISYIQN